VNSGECVCMLALRKRRWLPALALPLLLPAAITMLWLLLLPPPCLSSRCSAPTTKAAPNNC
jgi:hypothetical protein